MAWKDGLRNLNSTRRWHGLGAAAAMAWASLLPSDYSDHRIHLYGLTTPVPSPVAVESARSHTFHFATTEELEAIRNRFETYISDSDIEASRRGDQCLLQMDGENLVGYAWIAASRLVYIAEGFHINLPDDTIYNYKAYTAPAYRGKGFQSLRHLKLLAATPLSVTRLFGYVEHLNFNSRAGVRKSGYQPVGWIEFRRRHGRQEMRMELEPDFWCYIRRI